MARKREREIQHPYMQQLMSILECETLTEMSTKTGIPTETLRKWAFEERSPVATLETAHKLEQATGIELYQLLRGFQQAEEQAT